MKKFFKSLMLGLAVVPCAFLFAACGPEDPKDPPVSQKEMNIAALNSAMDKVELVGDNYTQTMSTNSTGIFDSDNGASQTAVTGDNGITTIAKFDGSNFAQEIAGQKVYYIDGVLYVETPSEEEGTAPVTTVDPVNYTAIEIAMPGVGMGVTDLTEILAGLKDFAYTTNENAIVATSNDVTITIEFADLLNTILDVVSENANSSLETLINELISELTDSEATVDTILADIEEWANDTTVEDVVGEENIDEIKVLAGTVVAYVDLMNAMEEQEPTITMTPVGGEDGMAFNSEIVTMVLGTINTVSSMTIEEIIDMLETEMDLPEGSDIYDVVAEVLESNTIASIITDMTAEEELEPAEYAIEVARNAAMVSGLLDSVTLNKVTATAKLNLVNNAFSSLDLVFALDADVAVEEGTNMDIVGALEACFELSAVGTTEVALPANVVYNGVESCLVKLSEEIAEGDDAGKIIITGVESKILDLIAPNGFETEESAVVVTRAAGATTYTITLSADTVTVLETNNVLMVNYSNTDGDALVFNFIVDAEIPAADPVE